MYLEKIIILISNILLFYLINKYLLKKKFLLDRVSDQDIHKQFLSLKSVPLSGGLILIINCVVLNYFDNYYNQILFISIYALGVLSDLGKFNSPKKRLIIQVIIISLYLFLNNIYIDDLRISFFDDFLKNKTFAIIFSVFCLSILINGSNFIDGANFQSSGYYLAILSCLFFLESETFLKIDFDFLINVYIFLIIFIIFNIFNKTFLGDGGIYLLSFLIGLFLIDLKNFTAVSPYFIAILLWYPAFENLFSIIRKIFIFKKRVDTADTYHFHHLLTKYLLSKMNYSKIFIATLASFLINIYNFIIFIISLNFIYSTNILVILILFNMLIYISLYYRFYIKVK